MFENVALPLRTHTRLPEALIVELVRMKLAAVGLAERVPVPASRREHYRLRDDAWAVLFTNQNVTISAMQDAAAAGIAAIGADHPAHHRLTQMRDFYTFLIAEIPALLDRWRERSAG